MSDPEQLAAMERWTGAALNCVPVHRRGNAVTETLFGSLKVERLHGMRFTARRQAKDEVMDWIAFYNHRRLHSTLGYARAMAFEQKWLARQISLAA